MQIKRRYNYGKRSKKGEDMREVRQIQHVFYENVYRDNAGKRGSLHAERRGGEKGCARVRRGREIGRRKDCALRALEGIARDMNVLKTVLCDEIEDREESIRRSAEELKYYLKKYEET